MFIMYLQSRTQIPAHAKEKYWQPREQMLTVGTSGYNRNDLGI